MSAVKPLYKTLLIIAIALYVAGVAIMQADLCARLGKIEHAMVHASAGPGHQH